LKRPFKRAYANEAVIFQPEFISAVRFINQRPVDGLDHLSSCALHLISKLIKYSFNHGSTLKRSNAISGFVVSLT
jgi:hypothetical protein